MQHVEKQFNIGHVQPDSRLLEQIQCGAWLAHLANPLIGRAADPPLELRDQLQPLRFAAAERWTRLSQLEIAKTGIDQKGERARNLWMRRKELRCFLDCHFHHVANRFLVVEHLKRLRIVTFAAAVFARHIATRQKVHLQFDHALTLASLATAAFCVERKSAGGIFPHTRDG